MCTISYITNQQTAISNQQKQVRELLQWDHEQYSNYMFETGMAYLSAYFSNNEALMEMLAGKKEFWNWFKNEWQDREQAFIDAFLGEDDSIDFRFSSYELLHNPIIMAAELTIPRLVYGDYSTTLKLRV